MNMTDNSKLCKVCQSVISTADLKVAITDLDREDGIPRADDEIIYPHQANVQDLQDAAQTGCPLCTILWDFFLNLQYPPERKGDNDRGQASFTFSVNYKKEKESSWHLNQPSYWFRMVYEDSRSRVDYKDAVEIYALGVESEFVHK
jgi:hypothetical protein